MQSPLSGQRPKAEISWEFVRHGILAPWTPEFLRVAQTRSAFGEERRARYRLRAPDFPRFACDNIVTSSGAARHCRLCQNFGTEIALFGDFRGILSRAEIEFAEEEKDSGSEVVEGTEAARIGLDGLDA